MIITVFSCIPSKMGKKSTAKVLYKVIQIDSVKNVYIVYARSRDTIYKILSVKKNITNICNLIFVNASYEFDLQSLFIRNFNGKYDITPDAIDLLTGVNFHGTLMTIDEGAKNQKRDLFEAINLQGLCFVK